MTQRIYWKLKTAYNNTISFNFAPIVVALRPVSFMYDLKIA